MGNNINSTPRLQIQKYYPNKRDQEGTAIGKKVIMSLRPI